MLAIFDRDFKAREGLVILCCSLALGPGLQFKTSESWKLRLAGPGHETNAKELHAYIIDRCIYAHEAVRKQGPRCLHIKSAAYRDRGLVYVSHFMAGD